MGSWLGLWAYPVHEKIEAPTEILCLILEFREGTTLVRGLEALPSERALERMGDSYLGGEQNGKVRKQRHGTDRALFIAAIPVVRS